MAEAEVMAVEDAGDEEMAEDLQALGIAMPVLSPCKRGGDDGDAASRAPTAGPTKKQKIERIGAAKPSKKNRRQCRGCQLWFCDEDMALGQNFDHSCKNKLDNIQRIAKAQGQMDWYRDVRSNDVKLQQVMVEYTNRVACNPRKHSISRGVTMSYLESVVCSTEVITEELGKFMFERQYMAFAETFDGGKLSESQAKHQWSSWKTLVETPETDWPPSDNKGPGGDLRIWVKTEDVIRFTNRMARKKELQLQHKATKNVSDQDMAAAHKKLQVDHDFMAGKGATADIKEDAKNMWGNTGGQAFQSRASDLPDIKVLENSNEDDAETFIPDDDEDADSSKKTELASEGGKSDARSSKRKGTGWFDYDKVVGRAQRAFTSSHENFVNELKWVLTKAEDVLTLLNNSDMSVKEKCKSEERVLSSRKEFLHKVVEGDATKLRELIAKFKPSANGAIPATPGAGDGAIPATPGAATVASRAVVGYAPPCASYDELITVQAISVIAQSFDEAKTSNDIKDTKGRIATARKPIKELAAAVNGAAKELTMARDLASKPASSAVAGRSKGRGKGAGKAGKGIAGDFSGATRAQMSSTTCPLLECGAENGVEITQVSTKDDEVTLAEEDCDYSMPMLINSDGIAKKMDDDKAIQGILDSFMNEFDKSAAKSKSGRGGMRCPASNDAVVQARQCLAGVLPSFVNDSSDEKLAPHMELSTFAVARDQLKPFCEQDNLATLRYQKCGTRKVFLTATEHMMKFMVDVKKLASAAVTPYRASLFMKVMITNHNHINSYVNVKCIYIYIYYYIHVFIHMTMSWRSRTKPRSWST